MIAELELIHSSNRCQLAELEKLQGELNPDAADSCETFYAIVMQIQACVIHTYQIIAFAAVRHSDPKEAAAMWKIMIELCESALSVIQKLREYSPQCGAVELYDLILNYREQSDNRYRQNLQDSECADPGMMKALFPQAN